MEEYHVRAAPGVPSPSHLVCLHVEFELHQLAPYNCNFQWKWITPAAPGCKAALCSIRNSSSWQLPAFSYETPCLVVVLTLASLDFHLSRCMVLVIQGLTHGLHSGKPSNHLQSSSTESSDQSKVLGWECSSLVWVWIKPQVHHLQSLASFLLRWDKLSTENRVLV